MMYPQRNECYEESGNRLKFLHKRFHFYLSMHVLYSGEGETLTWTSDPLGAEPTSDACCDVSKPS